MKKLTNREMEALLTSWSKQYFELLLNTIPREVIINDNICPMDFMRDQQEMFFKMKKMEQHWIDLIESKGGLSSDMQEIDPLTGQIKGQE